jgi:hypothetical protein
MAQWIMYVAQIALGQPKATLSLFRVQGLFDMQYLYKAHMLCVCAFQ